MLCRYHGTTLCACHEIAAVALHNDEIEERAEERRRRADEPPRSERRLCERGHVVYARAGATWSDYCLGCGRAVALLPESGEGLARALDRLAAEAAAAIAYWSAHPEAWFREQMGARAKARAEELRAMAREARGALGAAAE